MRAQGMKNKQEVKTESTLPAYCNPPNPCPVGYTGEFFSSHGDSHGQKK